MSDPSRRGRGLFFALPTLTVALAAFVLFALLRDRPLRFARMYGGPTLAAPQSFRLEVLDRFAQSEAAVSSGSARVVLRSAGGDEAVWSGTLGKDGTAEVKLPALRGGASYLASVLQNDRELARGRIELSAEAWRRAGSQRGGYLIRRADGLEVLFAEARGVLAVPFDDELLLEVRAGGQPIAAELELSAEGASLGESHVRTSGIAPGRVRITPRDHVVSVRARVSSEGHEPASASATLTVVPGALDAVVDGARLVVRSPVPRERAYVTLVNEHQRIAGDSLLLLPDDRGGASASLPLPALPAGPVWAVVSSAVDLESPGRVGWPLFTRAGPATTFDARELRLLDGLPQALARERLRRNRARLVGMAMCALALVASFLWLLAPQRRQAELERELRESGLPAETREAIAPPRRFWTLAGALCVALGFLLLGLFLFYFRR